MKDHESIRQAIEHFQNLVERDGPEAPRIVHCEATSTWFSDLLRTLSEHRIHVLGKGRDIIIYFNQEEEVIGWRDDGRQGTERQWVVDRNAFLVAVKGELDLPEATRLGQIVPRKLTPLGWTHQAVLFLAPVPKKYQVLRVWADPKTLKIIQCLRGSAQTKAESPREEPLESDAEKMKKTASEEVKAILTRRLDRGGIYVSRPDWYFQVEPGEPESYPAGSQVRVHTWRHWSSGLYQYQKDFKEPFGWTLDRYADPPTEEEISADEAIKVATTLIDIPEDGQIKNIYHDEFAPRQRLVWLIWKRVYQEMDVHGDFLRIAFHPVSHRLVSYQCKWRSLSLPSGSGDMTREEAEDLVEKERGRFDIDPTFGFISAKKGIVEYKSNREEPGKSEDRIAWVIQMACPWGWLEVHVDAIRHNVLDVIRSA
jgi:hypothetical protein